VREVPAARLLAAGIDLKSERPLSDNPISQPGQFGGGGEFLRTASGIHPSEPWSQRTSSRLAGWSQQRLCDSNRPVSAKVLAENFVRGPEDRAFSPESRSKN
jgi:hypothetical protein